MVLLIFACILEFDFNMPSENVNLNLFLFPTINIIVSIFINYRASVVTFKFYGIFFLFLEIMMGFIVSALYFVFFMGFNKMLYIPKEEKMNEIKSAEKSINFTTEGK